MVDTNDYCEIYVGASLYGLERAGIIEATPVGIRQANGIVQFKKSWWQ